MTAEIGQLALVLAFMLAIIQSLVPLWGAAQREPALMGLGRAAALLQQNARVSIKTIASLILSSQSW